MDSIRFAARLRVTIHALDRRSSLEGQKRYLPLPDDIISTALRYRTEPLTPYATLSEIDSVSVA